MQQRIQHLRSEINRHNQLYYIDNNPQITDAQYDTMFAKLVELENEYPEYTDANSPTQRIGSDSVNRFPRINHPAPMPSIKSCFSETDALTQLKKINSSNYFITPKYDGIAIEIHYNHNGMLTMALTRGNGYQGNDVTANIRTIHEIPKSIQTTIPTHVRGEIFIKQKEFNRLNKFRKQADIEPYKNIRSAAASLVKAKFSSHTAQANLSARFFSAPQQGNTKQQFQFLAKHFMVPEVFIAQSPQQAIEIANEKIFNRYNNHFFNGIPIDGAVIKSNTVTLPPQSRYHGGVIALKNNSPVWQSTIRAISHNVSSKGKISTIAHFQPITESGSTYFKALVTQPDTINQLHPGATVHVEISGHTVPKIIKVLSQGNPQQQTTTCPACHQPLTNGRCTNNTWCPSRKHTLYHVKQFVNYNVEIELPRIVTDGPGLYRAACLNKNAIIVRTQKGSHDYTLLADTLQTVQQIAIQIGTMLPGPHIFEQETEQELLQQSRKLLTDNESFLKKYSLNITKK